MSPNAIRMFGSVFLVVALIGFSSLFGASDQSSSVISSQKITAIQTKSFGNKVVFNSNLLNNYLNPPEIDPEITAYIMEGRPQLDIPEKSLPDDFVFVSSCLDNAGRCTPDGSYCANYPQGYKRF